MMISLTTNFGHNETAGPQPSVATPSAAAVNPSDWIFGWLATSASQGQLSNITDSLNGAIPSSQIKFFGNTGGFFNASLFFFLTKATSVAARTFTANFSVGANATIIAASFQGLDGASPLDQLGPSNNTGSGTTIGTGSAGTRFLRSGLVLAYFVSDGDGTSNFSAGSITVGGNSGFSGLGNATGGTNQPAFDAGYFIPTVNGPASGQISSSLNGIWQGAIVSLLDVQVQGRSPVIGPAKFRPQAGGSIGAQANLIAQCTARSQVLAALTAPTVTVLVGQRPFWGPSLPAPFNLNQFPGAAGSQQRPQAVLLATSSSRSSASAILTTGVPLAATLAAQSSVTPGLNTGIALFAAPAATAAVTPSLSNGIALASSPAGDSILSCTLATGIPLAASAFGVTSVSAGISGGAVLTSSLLGRSSMTGALTTGIRLNAQAFGQAFTQATLSKPLTFSTSLSADTTVSADLSIGSGFVATCASRVNVTATLETSASLSAICASRSNVSASLVQTFYRGDLIPIPPDDRRIVLKPNRRKV